MKWRDSGVITLLSRFLNTIQKQFFYLKKKNYNFRISPRCDLFIFFLLLYSCWIGRESKGAQNDAVAIERVSRNGERSIGGVQGVAEGHQEDFRRRHLDAQAVRRRGAEQVRGESSRDLRRRPQPPPGGGTWGFSLHLYHDRPSQAQRPRRLRYAISNHRPNPSLAYSDPVFNYNAHHLFVKMF